MRDWSWGSSPICQPESVVGGIVVGIAPWPVNTLRPTNGGELVAWEEQQPDIDQSQFEELACLRANRIHGWKWYSSLRYIPTFQSWYFMVFQTTDWRQDHLAQYHGWCHQHRQDDHEGLGPKRAEKRVAMLSYPATFLSSKVSCVQFISR